LADCMVKAFFPTDPDFQKQADRLIPWAIAKGIPE
jgi:hypothetical protein